MYKLSVQPHTFLIDLLAMLVRVAFDRKRIENKVPIAERSFDSIHSLWEYSTWHCFVFFIASV